MIAVVATLALPAFRPARAAYPNAVRFTVAPPLNIDAAGATPPAVSPDGHRFAFVAARGGVRQLWVRSVDALETQPLPGTEGAESLFWSPDNRTVAFEAEGKLKATDAESGLVRTLCDLPESLSGGSWSPGGDAIVFATPIHGLFSVSSGGGSPRLMPNPDAASTEARLFPTILPDGRYFIYLNSPSHVAWVGSLDGKEPPVRLLGGCVETLIFPPRASRDPCSSGCYISHWCAPMPPALSLNDETWHKANPPAIQRRARSQRALR